MQWLMQGMNVPNSTTRTTTETRTDAAAGTGVGKACDTKYYTTVEDRPVEKEVIERVVEHHPVEKKFVVETRPAGEHELTHQRRDESLGTREEIKRVAPKSSPAREALTLWCRSEQGCQTDVTDVNAPNPVPVLWQPSRYHRLALW